MPLTDAKIKAAILPALILSLAILPSCGERSKGPELPANPVLGIESRWGAVNAAYVRVKSRPSSRAEDLAYLRRAEVVEVASRAAGKDCLPEETGFWFGIGSGSSIGWVFSGYLDVYDSREKALLASRNMAP